MSTSNSAEFYIKTLGLQHHPEGGWFSEVYRSEESIPGSALPGRYTADRQFCTSIYYLLTPGEFSAYHRILSDETWHYYDGGTLLIDEIDIDGALTTTRLGKDLVNGECLQFTIGRNHWFGSRLEEGSEFVLAGCTVAPGFDFADFELADRNKLIASYPDHEQSILRLTHG